MPTILVVDDSPTDRRLAGGLLEKASGLQAIYASDGDEALVKIRNDSPHVVLTDLVMPGKNGLELVAEVVSQFPLIPIILMTGEGNEETAVQALQAGAASYVPKNSLADLMVDTIENVLDVSREEESVARLMTCMTKSECSFVLGNDFAMIPPLVNYLHRSVRSVGLCDESDGIRVCVALEEALNNALYHGNLELESKWREADRRTYRQLIEERLSCSPFRDRQVHVHVTVTPERGSFIIRDEGPGFDQSLLPDPTDPANLESPSGRGLLLMATFMDEMTFNENGNEVTLVKSNRKDGETGRGETQ